MKFSDSVLAAVESELWNLMEDRVRKRHVASHS